jgi:hypothetical protein
MSLRFCLEEKRLCSPAQTLHVVVSWYVKYLSRRCKIWYDSWYVKYLSRRCKIWYDSWYVKYLSRRCKIWYESATSEQRNTTRIFGLCSMYTEMQENVQNTNFVLDWLSVRFGSVSLLFDLFIFWPNIYLKQLFSPLVTLNCRTLVYRIPPKISWVLSPSH